MPLQALRAGRVLLVEVWKLRGLEAWLFQRLHPSRACRALCSLFSVRVAPARSVLCSPGRVSAPCPACASTPPVSVPLCLLCGLCVLRNLRFPCVVLRVPSWFFVSFVFSRKTLLILPAAPSVARLPRVLFSVLRSLFSGAAEPPLLGALLRPYRGRPRTLKGFDPDHYRVSPSTTIVVDLGPL